MKGAKGHITVIKHTVFAGYMH